MKKIKKMIMIIFVLIVLFSWAHVVYGSPSIQINVEGDNAGVSFVIFAPDGSKLGYDVETDQQYKEFPGGYSTGGINRIDSAEAYLDNPIEGKYLIELTSDALTEITLDISLFREIAEQGLLNLNFDGVIDKNLTSTLQFTYNSDPSKPAGTIIRVATPLSLKQDITLSRKIGWIDNDGITNSLLKKVEAAESSLAKGNKETAKNQLDAFINEVNAQKGKHISEKTVKILQEDVQYIIERL